MEDNFGSEKIVAELEQERDRLNQAIDLLKERNFPASARKIRRLGQPQRLRSVA